MAKHPIRGRTLAQVRRPGWSDFGEWRVGGKTHQGFDYYDLRGTWIYGTENGGVVTGRSSGGEAGHAVTIRYPSGRITRDVHMLTPSPLWIGARVNEDTLVGWIGQSGNAAAISWQGLLHVHHEVYIGGKAVDPIKFYGSLAPAGGSAPTPITPAAPESPEEEIVFKIIAPLGLTDRGIIAPGFGLAFGNEGDFLHICNVWGLDPKAITPVGAPGDTPAQRRAIFNSIISMMRAGSAPIPIAPQVNVVPIVDAVRAAIAQQGVQVDLEPVITAVTAAAAGINANIDDQPTSFVINPKE